MKKTILFSCIFVCFLLIFSSCKKDKISKDGDKEPTETPIVIPGTFIPDHDGSFIQIDGEIKELSNLMIDIQSVPSQLRFWLYSSATEDYPQYSGWMDNQVGACVNAALQYMQNENDLNEEGFPLWQGTELTTILISIDQSEGKINASQTGILKNSVTCELKPFCIILQNAHWQVAPEASKKALN